MHEGTRPHGEGRQGHHLSLGFCPSRPKRMLLLPTENSELHFLPLKMPEIQGIGLFFFFFFFLGPHLQHREVPRLRVESELQLPATATATAT